MDTIASQTSSKSQRNFGQQYASRDEDLISKLPEDILVRILSFVSTKEAIKTSALSKRWKYLWISIPNFTFMSSWSSEEKNDEKLLELWETFFGSIDRALILRNASCLGNLWLWFSKQVDASRFKRWMPAAVKHKVQKLTLYLPQTGKFVFPNSLFTSESLRIFKLTMQCTLKVPGIVCFSSLKSLSLWYVTFQDDRSAQQLFSGCPVLEKLKFHDCDWRNIMEITIESPTLKSLSFTGEYGLFNSKLMVSALNLETLCVHGYLTVELILCSVPSLNSALIDILEITEPIFELLPRLQNVTSLSVSNEYLESLLEAENHQWHLPTFYNLTSLKAYVNSPYEYGEYDDEIDDHTSGALVYILQKSPNLECLEVPRVFKPEEQNMIFESVPICFQSSLKQLIFFDIHGEEYEIRFLKYLYENAPILKRLIIGCSPTLSEDLEKQEEICCQLQQLRGASGSCLIEFFPYKSFHKIFWHYHDCA